VIDMGFEKLTRALSAVNFYRNKAWYIWKTAHILADREYMPSLLTSSPSDIYKQWGYRISDNIDELTKLPGVGVKTAKVVLHCLYDQDVIAVDTHVHRVSNRLWIVHTRSPEQTAKEIEQVIPQEFLGRAHHLFVLFGRYHCKAKKPDCDHCKLSKICEWYKNSRQ
jgi:endonuclease-3